jgi:F420H(2)-dependent quinone reductase
MDEVFGTHRCSGTRGARQPSGPFFRWLNNVAARRRRKGGKMMGFNALVLTTVGCRSGLERTNPVGWSPGQDGSRLIVASAAGAAANARAAAVCAAQAEWSGAGSSSRGAEAAYPAPAAACGQKLTPWRPVLLSIL